MSLAVLKDFGHKLFGIVVKFIESASVCDGILAFAGSALSTLDMLAVDARVAGLRITQRPRHIVQAPCGQFSALAIEKTIATVVEPDTIREGVRDTPPPYEAAVRILKKPTK